MPPRLHCDLQRFTQAVNRSGDFVQHLWIQFAVSVHVVSFLHSSDQQCCFATCLVIYIDRAELALGATEIREGLNLSSWSVPTPPVQVFGFSFSSFESSSDDSL